MAQPSGFTDDIFYAIYDYEGKLRCDKCHVLNYTDFFSKASYLIMFAMEQNIKRNNYYVYKPSTD